MHDLLIKGGTVVDPSQGLHTVRDVAFSDGKVAALAESISEGDADEVFDATGLIVTPGLIDLHVHSFWGAAAYGIRPDVANLARGVTTAVDAGTSGAWTFPAFRLFVIDRVETRLYALLNIATTGIPLDVEGELKDLKWADVKRTVEVGLAHKDVVLGIKARLGRVQAGDNDVEALKRAIDAAQGLGGFVMVHVGNTPTPLPELMRMLRPGDVVTHAFHGFGDGVLDGSGAVIEGMKEAQDRGIVIDIGHGGGGFSFIAAERALSEGLLPGNISSDLHTHNIAGPVYDLITTLSKLMHLGMSLDEVVSRSTDRTARTMGLEGTIGTLKVGAEGDATIMRLEEGRFQLRDRIGTATTLGPNTWAPGVTVEASQRLTHVLTVKSGKIYRPWFQ